MEDLLPVLFKSLNPLPFGPSRSHVRRWPAFCAQAAPGVRLNQHLRTRWFLGTIQVALLSNAPFRGQDYTFMQRLHYFH